MIARVHPSMRSSLSGDEGSSMVPFLLLFPILVMLLELVVIGGRLAVVTGDVQSAAREAARQASIASGRSSAASLVGPVAQESLDSRGIECQGFDARLAADTNYIAGGHVTAMVTCNVSFTDLGFVLTPPGTVQVRRLVREPIDTYRIVTP